MKRVIVILLSALFFFILLALVLYKLFAPTAPKESVTVHTDPFSNTQVTQQAIYNDSPYRTTLTCYTWYLQAYMRGAMPSDVVMQPEAAQCFTTAFSKEFSDSSPTGADPVLFAQDTDTSWKTGTVSIVPLGDSIRTSDQRVILPGANQPSISVHLVQQEDQSWRIDSASLQPAS